MSDGRLLGFDYWSVDTIVRAANRKYTIREKFVFDMYNKIMNIAAAEKSVVSGLTFDLMYVNGHLQRQYAFLRKVGAETLLVVVNFDDLPASVNVNIPAHAFDYLNIKEKNVVATDLLSGEKLKLSLKRDEAVPLEVKPLSTFVLKFKA